MKSLRILWKSVVNTLNTSMIHIIIYIGTAAGFRELLKILRMNTKFKGIVGFLATVAVFLVSLKIKKIVRKLLYKAVNKHLENKEHRQMTPEEENSIEKILG